MRAAPAGHDVVSVGRSSGDLQADITDIRSLNNLFNRGGPEKYSDSRFKADCVGIASASDLRDDYALISWCRGDGGANAIEAAGRLRSAGGVRHVSAQLS